jgi:hypothetical protein
MTHPLVRGAVGPDRGPTDVSAVLTSSTDPAGVVAPGAELHLELTVTAGDTAAWGCGYLLLDEVVGAATVTAAEGAEWFPDQRWFRVRADAGRTATGRFTLRVADRRGAPTVRPSMALSRAGGAQPTRTPALSDAAFRVTTRSVAGLRLAVPVDAVGELRLPDGAAAPLDIAAPRFGAAAAAPDGRTVRYTPRPGFTGYDRFTVGYRDAGGATRRAVVTVHVGDLTETPGLLPDAGVSGAEQHRWQENEVTGTLPWPTAARTSAGTRGKR